ncbi:MAG TPA: hypothetical protein VIM73_05690, partial [Polyangiaceae bacterium]
EVCASAVPTDAPSRARGRIRRLLVESRIVALCEQHARAADEAGVASLAELRALFPEPSGLRSLVPRRTPLDRRVFPPRPEGRRRSLGRRATDDDA